MLFETHWQAFLDRPWLGHGLGTFHAINAYYATPENWRAVLTVGAAHNVVLQSLEESGLIGFALLSVMVLMPVTRAFRAAITGRSGQAWSSLAVATTVLVYVHGMVDFGLNVPGIAALFAFMLGAYSRRGVLDA
jgi:O-antigen ligase